MTAQPRSDASQVEDASAPPAPYRCTPVFDETSLPEALRGEHRTKAGTWGVIRILEGALRYTIIDPPSVQILTPNNPGLVAPQQTHFVTPLGRVRCQVEFYRAQPVIEPR